MYCLFFFKQKTAYEMRISDWSSDVCSSDLILKAVAVILPKILFLLTVEKILRGEAEHEAPAEALFDEGFEIRLVAQRNGLVEVRFQRGAAAGNGGSETRVDTRHILDEAGDRKSTRLNSSH